MAQVRPAPGVAVRIAAAAAVSCLLLACSATERMYRVPLREQ